MPSLKQTITFKPFSELECGRYRRISTDEPGTPLVNWKVHLALVLSAYVYLLSTKCKFFIVPKRSERSIRGRSVISELFIV